MDIVQFVPNCTVLIRYIDTDFRKQFDEIKDKYFVSKSEVYHYLSMAKGNFREYLKKDMAGPGSISM